MISSICRAGIAQLVEHDLAKVGVASSSLVSRSKFSTGFTVSYKAPPCDAGIAQLVEHDLAKVGVASSSLVSRSKLFKCCICRRASDSSYEEGLRNEFTTAARFTPLCGNSSVGRARPCQGRGREFESRFPLQILSSKHNASHHALCVSFSSFFPRGKHGLNYFCEQSYPQILYKFCTAFYLISQYC